MRRLPLCFAAAAAALAAVPAAAADGPLYVTQGGTGVAARDGALHYVALSDGPSRTLVETVDAASGAVNSWVRVAGSWGIPSVGMAWPVGQGLSRDGRTLVLGPSAGPYATPSRFLVLNVPRLTVRERITLPGAYSFDALSPSGSRLYLIEYLHARGGDLQHYVVRAYDLARRRLLPGRIADRAEKEKTMSGYALSRTTSAGGRWVFTLYENPGGKPFVHALDTVAATAHCIELPWSSADQGALGNVVLSVRDGGRTLALRWRSGRPWLRVAVGSWRMSAVGAGSPWPWVGAGAGASLVLLAAWLLLRRRRGQELREHARHELGLA